MISESVMIEPGMRIRRSRSKDGTSKYAFDLGQGLQMEGAFFRVPGRERPNIACVSTQVGCAVGCVFCATSQTPFFRNLSKEEILYEISSILDDQCTMEVLQEVFEVSFMGMGEPLANLKNLLAAIKEIGLLYPEITRVSVSTTGPARRIDALTEEMPIYPPVHLQISLHATKDKTRQRLVPHAPETISKLLEAGRRFHDKTGDQVFVNYVLLKGINDSAEDARWLAQLDRQAFYLKISALNLIARLPSDISPASMDDIRRFSAILMQEGLAHKIFVGDGLDVQASCGQLAATPRELTPDLLSQEVQNAGNFSRFGFHTT